MNVEHDDHLKLNQLLLVVFMSTLLCSSTFAAPQDIKTAVQLIDEMEGLYRGSSSRATLNMHISSPHFKRSMKMITSNMGTDFSLIRILSPRKDKGISTLKRHKEMWNYFPKINKKIKVPPSMMMGSWMGSDFSNDDLIKQTTLTEDYDLELIEADNLYTITLVPKEQTITVWGKIEYIIDKEFLTPHAQRFYDDNLVLVRELKFMDIKDFSGRMIPSKLEMIPLNKADHKTTIIYEHLEFDPPDINSNTFTLRNLQKRT